MFIKTLTYKVCCNSLAFKENEKQANLYSVHCMQVLSVVMVVIWLLNCLGVFIVPTGIMNTATIGGMLFLLLPSLLLRFLDQDSHQGQSTRGDSS